jgi:hypothetical protein
MSKIRKSIDSIAKESPWHDHENGLLRRCARGRPGTVVCLGRGSAAVANIIGDKCGRSRALIVTATSPRWRISAGSAKRSKCAKFALEVAISLLGRSLQCRIRRPARLRAIGSGATGATSRCGEVHQFRCSFLQCVVGLWQDGLELFEVVRYPTMPKPPLRRLNARERRVSAESARSCASD